MRVPRWIRASTDEERDEELDEELAAHLRMATADRVARGEGPDEARYAARRELGNLGHIKEVTRESWGGLWIDRFGQDVRYALRTLARARGLTLAVVLTLALGIGANTAVFTAVNGVLLRPLAFPHPDELFVISYQSGQSPFGGIPSMDDRNFLVLRERTRAFARVATFDNQGVTLTGTGDPARSWAARVTPELIPLLGVAPAIGRPFRAEEGRAGEAPVVIIGDRLWRHRFGAEVGALGRMVSIDGVAHTIVGVMPPGFDFPRKAELWIPLAIRADQGNVYSRPVIGRLAPRASDQQAEAELDALVPQLSTFAGVPRDSWIARVVPLRDALVGDVKRSLWVFAGAVGFVLLVACANVANLLLLRGISRSQELAVRATLGASRPRLLRQLLTESTVLSLAGGAVGVLLAAAGVRTLLALAPAGRIPRVDEVHIDGWVLTFTFVLSMLVGILFGILPALRVTGRSLGRSLLNGTRSVTSRWGALPSGLVVGEIALALVLLAGAGLMARSFVHMRTVELGFEPQNVVAMTLELPEGSYGTAAQMSEFHTRMLSRLEGLPGVEAAGLVNWRPLGSMRIAGDFWVDDGRAVPPYYRPDKMVVSAGYFRAMGIRLVRGRQFTPTDDAGGMKTVIVSESVARAVWPGDSPVGRRITLEEHPEPDEWLTVVGVVDDIVQEAVVTPPRPAIYVPYGQVTRSSWLGRMGVTFVAQTASGMQHVAAGMHQVLREVDPDLPPLSIAPMDELVTSTTAEPLFQARLLGAFAILAVVLASVGTYGVLAYSVAVRTHEIGIRLALGARASAVLAMVLKRSLVLAMTGVALGVGGAFGITRVLATFLYGVTPTDPLTFASVAVLLCAIAVGAGLIPAIRASRVDPLRAIKVD